jgi:hypothetical protein
MDFHLDGITFLINWWAKTAQGENVIEEPGTTERKGVTGPGRGWCY